MTEDDAIEIVVGDVALSATVYAAECGDDRVALLRNSERASNEPTAVLTPAEALRLIGEMTEVLLRIAERRGE